MCSESIIEFCKKNFNEHEIASREILEVGSFDVNGSIRSYVEEFSPRSYVGTDITEGPNVDLVVDANNLISEFGTDSFDFIICTEVVEHVQDWRNVINNIKGVLRQNGCLLLTTRSRRFPYHGYPYDYWRYEISDMKKIFSEFDIDKLASDPTMPGVFVKVFKNSSEKGNDLDQILLYSILTGTKVKNIHWFHYLFLVPINLIFSKFLSYLRIFRSKL